MRRKLRLFLIICLLIWICSPLIGMWLFWVLAAIGVITALCLAGFLVANKLLTKTNWWQNQYMATRQFVSGVGYREDIQRNYDIVNLGSNPAHFAFFYENVKGQSWATGSQGQDMDFEILKFYHSYLKKGGTVLIPIMPFTAISPYLKERPDCWGMSYYSKFAKILDYAQVQKLPYGRVLLKYLRFPLFFNKKAIRYLFKDVAKDNRYEIAYQSKMLMELEFNASHWIKAWLAEFKLRNLLDVKDERWTKYYQEAVDLNRQIVDFCLERDLKPVFICVPMTQHLSKLFPQEYHQYMVTDFVKAANVHNVPFLDYTKDKRFQDDDLYFDSFFLNLRGRKMFTKQVLQDLRLI